VETERWRRRGGDREVEMERYTTHFIINTDLCHVSTLLFRTFGSQTDEYLFAIFNNSL